MYSFTPELIICQFLYYCYQLIWAESQEDFCPQNVLLVVPYMNRKELETIIKSSKMIGLKEPNIIYESSAIALYYYKEYFDDSDEEVILFIDFGFNSVKSYLTRIKKVNSVR